jgi:uncharacterized protein (TIGR02145 family)
MNSFKKNIYRTAIEDPCPDCIAHDVTIDTQTWTGCNADVSTYRDGTLIPEVTDPTAWIGLTTGAWCYANNNSSNNAVYGKLYNWYAVAGIYDAASLANPALRKEFAPSGYHVPNLSEWNILISYLGGAAVAGGALKQNNLCLWNAPNTGATDISGFTALPGGDRQANGSFQGVTTNTGFWTSTDFAPSAAWMHIVFFAGANIIVQGIEKIKGHSVRFIKD